MLFINIKILFEDILLNMLKKTIIFNCVCDLSTHPSWLKYINKMFTKYQSKKYLLKYLITEFIK